MWRKFFLALTFLAIFNGENARNWVSNLMLKYHDDPTVKKSEIIILIRQVWVYAGKREDFGREKEKTKLRGRRDVETIVSMKTDLTCLYL